MGTHDEIGAAQTVDGHGAPYHTSGGIVQVVSIAIEDRKKRAANRTLKGPRCRREVGARSGYVSTPVGVHGNRPSAIIGGSAEKRGINKAGTIWVNFRHEGVGAITKAFRGLANCIIGSFCHRKILRPRRPRHVCVAGAIHGDDATTFAVRASQIRRVGQHRVDDERLGGVVCRDLEADPVVSAQDVPALDAPPFAVVLLIDHRLQEPDLAAGEVHDEVALGVDLQPLGALETQRDGARVGPGATTKSYSSWRWLVP